jgi:dipeptidyl aminopeptidase/acylaminoacyl peptidase
MKRIALLVALFLLLSAGILPGQNRKSFDPLDLVNLKTVRDPQISPDGNVIAYVVETPMPAGERRNSQIWLVPSGGSSPARPFVTGGVSNSSPRWSPDGLSLAFLSDRDNSSAKNGTFPFRVVGAEDRQDLAPPDTKPGTPEEKPAKPASQIWLISFGGGEAIPLTAIPGGVKKFKWSGDGKLLAFVRTDQDTKQELERKQRKEDHLEVDRNYKFDRLWVCDLAAHEARLVTKENMNIDDFDWAPDGSRFLARISPTPRIDDYWRVSRISILSVSSGSIVKTLLEHAAYNRVSWSPDGRTVLFGKPGPRDITGIPVLYDLLTAKETVLGEAYPATLETIEWDPDSNSLTASGVEGATPVFFKVDAHSGSLTRIGKQATTEPFTLSKDGQKLAFLGQTMEHPDEVYVNAAGQDHMLTSTNPQVKNWKLGTSEELSWIVHGILLLPVDYEKGKRYKTIVHFHGGPEEAWAAGFHGSWYDWGGVLASHGYAVLLPNPRGSDGAGTSFAEANYRDWGYGDFQDSMDGVDLLVSRGIADADHLGVGGWSYGGFMTSWTITHTDRFKAAIVGAAVTDLFTMAATSDIDPSYLDGYYGSLRPNVKLYDDHSPVRFLEHCHTPALVIHGEADVRVPISQGQEFYYGLRFLGGETQMVRYPREPHIFQEMEHQRDSLERMLGWYDSHLQ